MPATINGGGDQLARGAVRATFRSPNVSQEKWNQIFGEDSGPKPNISGGNSDSEASGVAGTNSGKTRKRKK